jgi:hypothetical protein
MSVLQMIFTDLPRGQGVNPSSSGYQIKTCSSELAAEQRDWLSAICMHYGDAVYRSAPQKAIDKETAWRAKTDNLRLVPAEVLEEFPIAVSYTCLEERGTQTVPYYALTQVRYTGLTHDGRPGNFLAYALFFHPDELNTHNSNPMVAAAAAQIPDESGSGLLALPGIQGKPGTPDFSILNTEPYASRLEALISALCTASPKNRPLLLGIKDWRDSAPLLRALLALLPPARRRLTSVCSYESDRNWLPVLRGQRPAGWLAAHHVLVLSGLDERNPGLRQDEIQSRFATFNFVNQQFSDLGAPRPFAVWTAECVRAGNNQALENYFRLLERMGVDQTPDAWDELVSLARIETGERTAVVSADNVSADLVQASKALVEAAKKYQHPEIALDWFSNRIDRLVANQDFTNLGLLAPEINNLLNDLKTPESQVGGKRLLEKIQEQASRALQQGQVQLALSLCHMTGSGRDAMILQLLRQVLVDKTVKMPELKSRAEQERWLDLLLEGMAGTDRLKVQDQPKAGEHLKEELPRDLLLKTIFQAAGAVGRTDELWNLLGKPVILPYLAEGWNAEKRGLVEQLLKSIPAGESPEAVLTLSLKLIQHTSPADPGWLALARRIAAEANDSQDAEPILGDLLKLVQERISDKEQQVFTLGVLADVVRTDHADRGTAGGKKLVAAYDESLRNLEPKEILKLRRKLAENGAVSILARDLQREVIPWNPEKGPALLQRWRDVVPDQHPKVLERVRVEVAARLQNSEQGEAFVPLALELLPKDSATSSQNQAARTASQDVLGLWDGLLLRLPLTPEGPGGPGAMKLPRPPANLSPESSRRVRIIQFLSEIQQSARADNAEHGPLRWSLADFPSAQPGWSQDVRALNPKEKRQVWLWCLGTFGKTGITQSAHAGGLVQALEAIGERAWFSDSVANLLQGRDPVTCILAFTAFVDKGLGSHHPAEWGRFLREILGRTDKTTQRMFEEHLVNRFAPRNKGYQEKLVILSEEAGLVAVAKSVRAQLGTAGEKPAGYEKTDAAKREPVAVEQGGTKDRPVETKIAPDTSQAPGAQAPAEAPKAAGERLSGTFKRLFGKKESESTPKAEDESGTKIVPKQEE